jgi:hypothetical protein
MANLKQAGTQRLAQLSKRPDLPPWWRPMSYLLLAAFAIYVGVAALRAPTVEPLSAETLAWLRQDSSAQPPSVQPPSVQPPTASVPIPPSGGASSGDAAGVEVPPAGDSPGPGAPTPGDVVVATVQGGSVTVAAAAYDVARDAARALFSGTFEQVLLSSNAVVPTGLPRYAEPVVGATLVEIVAEGRVVFSTLVDPDGPGPELSRPVTVTVVLESGLWRFDRFGF